MAHLMTRDQQMNVLHWVEGLLSGNYQHGTLMLYNPNTKCYCALGVAADTQFVPRNDDGTFVGLKTLGWTSDRQWFEVTFGLPRNASLYTTINDYSKDYLPVAALLLHAVPDDNPKKASVHKNLMEKFNAANKERQKPHQMD